MTWFEQAYAFYDFLRPVLDIGLLAFLLYKGYELLAKTQAFQLLKGAGFLAGVYGLAFILGLQTMQWVLTIAGPGLIIATAIVFQPELRKIFLSLGQGDFFRLDSKPHIGHFEPVLTAAELLSQQRRGMLVIFARSHNLKEIVKTGTKINGEISTALIMSIFQFDTPMHDGAVVIQNGKIAAAGCFLPLSEQQDIRKNFGTRHRASLGMSEQSDAVVLVVSEETGAISLAYDSKLYYDLSLAEVARKLKQLFEKAGGKKSEKKDLAGSAGEKKDIGIE
ncbi:MAG: diadenylate cyclase CdaA [Spirochaetes bacterium]|nr:diadenylate cyclase CdaA [Spirochaetota bacterium]